MGAAITDGTRTGAERIAIGRALLLLVLLRLPIALLVLAILIARLAVAVLALPFRPLLRRVRAARRAQAQAAAVMVQVHSAR